MRSVTEMSNRTLFQGLVDRCDSHQEGTPPGVITEGNEPRTNDIDVFQVRIAWTRWRECQGV